MQLRGQRVILDFDLAQLYGVTTSRLNEQIKRNKDRFPEDFMDNCQRAHQHRRPGTTARRPARAPSCTCRTNVSFVVQYKSSGNADCRKAAGRYAAGWSHFMGGTNHPIGVLLLEFLIVGHKLFGVMATLRRDLPPDLANFINHRIRSVRFRVHRSFRDVPGESIASLAHSICSNLQLRRPSV